MTGSSIITMDERVQYRQLIGDLQVYIDKMDDHISGKAILPKEVLQVIENNIGTTDPGAIYRALKTLQSKYDKEYDEHLRYAGQFRFSPFCEYMRRGEVPALHQEFLIDYMEEIHLSAATKGKQGIARLSISLPPGAAKTTYASHRFAAWHLGRKPDDRWLQGAHTQTFAKDRLGKVVRGLMQESRYHNIFEEMRLSPSSSAADYFEFTAGSGYYKAVGVGVGISGYRADIGAIDDPIASREDAESTTSRRKLHEWFEDDFGTRPMPGSPVYIVACLTGDTPVTMADGTWKPMKEILEGDCVASYDSGMTTGKVTAVRNQGPDNILELKTGNATVRGNAKHPFLVSVDGDFQWVRMGDIKAGDKLVTHSLREYEKSATMSAEEAWVIGFMKGDGWVTVNRKTNYDKSRDRGYKTKSYVTCVADCPAHPERVQRVLTFFHEKFGAKFKLTKWGYYRTEKAQLGRYMLEWGMDKKAQGKRVESSIYSEPVSVRMAFLDGMAAADGCNIVAGKYDAQNIGLCNRMLIEDLRVLARSVGRVVTNVYEREGVSQPPNSPRPVNWYRADFRFHVEPVKNAVHTTTVTRVTNTGELEDVYDLTVSGAENFVADGLIVHNTRWHEDDLTGHELQKMAEGRGEKWEVINIPAIAVDDDVLGREPGEGLWPEVFGTEFYLKQKRSLTGRSWNSLYMGNPVDEEGGVLKREDVSRYKNLPKDEIRNGTTLKKVIKKITLSVDCAEKATQRSDYTAATIWVETTDKKHYLIHAARIRKEFVEMVDWIDHLARIWEVDQVLVEDRGAGTQYIQVRQSNPGPAPVVAIQTKQQSKEFRFDGVTPMFAAGQVFLPETGTDWIADVEAEIFAFPAGKNDDYVDTISQYLTKAREGSAFRKGVRKMRASSHAR